MFKIWILNHYAITPDMPGGTRHYDLSKELVSRGHEVVIFASSFNHSVRKELKLDKRQNWKLEIIDEIQFVWLKTFPYKGNNWRRAFNMVSFLWQSYFVGINRCQGRIAKPEVIIGSSVHPLAALAGYLLALYYRKPFIMEVRDLWPQTLVDMGKAKEGSIKVRMMRFLEKYLYKKARKIIVALPLAADYITCLGINREKIIYLPNGVSAQFLRMIEKLGRGGGHKGEFVYAGAHGHANGLDVILDAAKIVQGTGREDIKFVMIGDGPEKPRLVKRKKNENIKNVIFCDPMRKNEIFPRLVEADGLIFNLLRTDVFKYGLSSNKLFDYMAAGRPIIFSAQAGNNPVAAADCGLSISPQEPKLMAQAIVELCDMETAAKNNMGQKGREFVKKEHSISKLAQKLEREINQICSKK